MTFGRKKEEPAAIQPAAQPARVVQAVVELTFLEKERLRLIEAKHELASAQQNVADIQANVAWLEINPGAEKIFRDLLEREFNSRLEAEVHARDKAALDALVQKGGNRGQEKGQGQAGAETK